VTGWVGMAKKRVCRAVAASLLLYVQAGWAAEDSASFTVDVKLGETPLELLQVTLNCYEDGARSLSAQIPPGDSRSFSIPVRDGVELTCLLGAKPIAGQRLRFLGDGGSLVELTDQGCLFSGVQAGHANFCQITVESQGTTLTVYKKWIGAADREADVEIRLDCAAGLAADAGPDAKPAPGTQSSEGSDRGPRMINEDKPAGWDLEITDPDGLECDVLEAEREDFRADISDCQGLIIVPGAREECTMVNTKVVKMIQMLNRYGLVIMILVFLAAGMLATRKMMP
jgi:hypothetical protein